MSFNKLKKQRSNIAELAAKLEADGKKTYETDERFWYPKREENGNGFAVIRFLPPKDGEDVSFVKTFRHGYQGPRGWYIEECPTTIGGECPVCIANSKLYDDLGKDEASRIVSGKNGRKRKMQYVSNIYVISDPETPENEGKNFLFKYGSKIFDKIKLATKPEFPDEIPIDPFDIWEGADFTLKIRKVDGNVNYDSSKFEKSKELLENDSQREAVYNSLYSLDDIISKDKYKTFEKLKLRFDKVSGNALINETSENVFNSQESEKSKTETSPIVTQESILDESENDAETLEFFKDFVDS